MAKPAFKIPWSKNRIITGEGSPQGVVSGKIGDDYRQTDGGVNTTLWIKTENGTKTGWCAVFTQATNGGDGTVSLPSYSYASDPHSGMYRIGSNNIGIAVGGTKVFDYVPGGATMPGTLTVAGLLTAPVVTPTQAMQQIAGNGYLVRTAGKAGYIVSATTSGGAVTGNTIPTAGAVQGEVLTLIGASDTDTVSFAKSASQMLGGTRVLGLGDVLKVYFDGTRWCEISFSSNAAS